MANRSLRRTPSRVEPTAQPVQRASVEPDTNVDGKQGAESTVNQRADGNDSHVDGVSDTVERVRVIDIDPAELGERIRTDKGNSDGNGDGSETGKRRTRKDAGQARGTRRKKETPANLTEVVSMVHTLSAVLLSTPELELDDEETKKLADAYAEFCVHHEVPVLTPKRMSEIALGAVVCKLYVPRLIAVRNRKVEERKARNAQKVVSVR